MSLNVDEISRLVPFYLTGPQKDGLLKAFAAFPNCNYYCSGEHDGFLQGDGWTKLEVIRFENAERRQLRGILISNSCDIEIANKRALPPKVLFAPMVPLEVYKSTLLAAGVALQRVEGMIADARAQRVTSIFYLPEGRGIGREHVVFLDDVHSLPLSHYLAVEERTKLFSLSQIGFYVFLMKLSIHFCRMHEGEERGSHHFDG